MKTLFILSLAALLGINSASAQSTNDMYIIFTSIPMDSQQEVGVFMRNTPPLDMSIYDSPPIGYMFASKTKRFEIRFMHYNYNIEKLSKIRPVKPTDRLQIITKPASFLNTVNLIDLDVLGPQMTKEEALQLRDSIGEDKIVYLIDRNDITDGSVKLIQATVSIPKSF